MNDDDALRDWTRANVRARLAYRAQPLSRYGGGTCLGACHRAAIKGRPYCTRCELIWGNR